MTVPMEDSAAIIPSSAMASFRLAKGRIKRLKGRLVLGELGEGGGGDEGGEDRPLVKGWGSGSCGEDPTKSGAWLDPFGEAFGLIAVL